METCFQLDLIHQLPDFLKEKSEELYNYSINDIVVWQDELVYILGFKQKEYIQELGLEQSGLDKLIQASYKLLRLITFLTTGPEETKAWTVKKGAKAPGAAGVIHTDFEKGFIRAEIINWQN